MRRDRTRTTPSMMDRALGERLPVLAAALRGPGTASGDARAEVLTLLTGADDDVTWLALAVISGQLPTTATVQRVRRAAQLDGPEVILKAALEALRIEGGRAEVQVASGAVVIDIEHLSRTSLGTGIQRVTRETLKRWAKDHEITAAGWLTDHTAMRRLTEPELSVALGHTKAVLAPVGMAPAVRRPQVIVPWESTYVLPEVVLEPGRTRRLEPLFRFSRSRTAAIGFDTVPLTSAETSAADVPPHFALELAAIRHVDRVATISEAAGTEYLGWRTMVRSMGLAGPDIAAISLPVEAAEPSPAALAEASCRYVVPTIPMVLCVGSHEPRKNHLAVLHAAELLWRSGVEFSLLFVGGNAWKSEGFTQRLAELRASGRPVESVLGLSDRLLWALYSLAHCTVFPSVNEGFGLPVAESLASGTPAITSQFGSMLEIACDGGALTVDPRDDHSLAAALRSLLTDRALHERLVLETRSRPQRTWDQYAAETWDYLVDQNVSAAAGL
ncbi:glycosyltransferase family 4 protein [Pengzhenrongella frigida]|uniref:Glycosyltransferase family 1 protein n=1 Tax=Pengzhenrongella frigida TaxID=1259133 RepID=A0A4Q5N000_9MICO|nr:glycosyltransferase family 1 protein [Cellulomonas sp. HLT2-17]RYV51368.1 glycosyltransferase family 1 protein [Cellulomonas sp. HLT2-17]